MHNKDPWLRSIWLKQDGQTFFENGVHLILENLFIIGVVLILIAALWFFFTLFTAKKQILLPFLLAIVGVLVVLTPVIYTRLIESVDLGEREKIVNNEMHLTLTGWDKKDYQILTQKKDAVVLQMANSDVTDEVLTYLKDMNKLRKLDLNDSGITDSGLTILAGLKSLEELKIRSARVSDEGTRKLLDSLPQLKNIDVRQTDVSRETIDEWKSKLSGRRALQ